MKALSIKQPWAWLIVNSYKDIENRSWPLPKNFEVPQRIYVHTGKFADWRIYQTRHIRDLLSDEAWDEWVKAHETGITRGAIVGEVTITDLLSPCAPYGINDDLEEISRWYDGDPYYGFHLTDPVAYDKPIPYKGKLGFFEVTLPEMVE